MVENGESLSSAEFELVGTMTHIIAFSPSTLTQYRDSVTDPTM